MRHSKPAAVIVVSSFVLWACSSAPPSSSKDDDQRSGATGRDTSATEKTSTPGKTNDGTNAPPGTQSPQEPAGACTAAQGEDACFSCCEAKHPKGSEVIEQLVETWLACACAPAACATQCAATACSEEGAEPVDGDACDQCLQRTSCDDQFEAACQADADCAEISTCESGCFPADEMEEEEDEDDVDRAHAASKAQRIASMYSRVPQLHRARR